MAKPRPARRPSSRPGSGAASARSGRKTPRAAREGTRSRAPRTRPQAAPAPTEILARRIAAMCSEKRAEDVVVLDVRGLADYMDFLVIASGGAERQNRAIADHVVRSLRGEKVRPLSVAGADGGTWICVDFVDVVLHLFDRATREHYDLELLWGDAPLLDLETPVKPAKPRRAAKAKDAAAETDAEEPTPPTVG